MRSDWKQTTLGEICEMRSGSVFPRAKQGKLSGKYPFIKVSDMNLPMNAINIHNANNWVDENELSELKAKPLPAGATVFAKIGEALKQNRLRYIVKPTILDNNMMGLVPSEEHVTPRFLYYAMAQFDFGEIAGGTALPYLAIRDLSALQIALPSLAEQRRIAHILGTLDDKIELNRRMNATLEGMALALYKSWFVDFEPVRAKMSDRWRWGESLPGMPADLYDAFPTRLVPTEAGDAPDGWEVGQISDIADISSGKRPPARYPKPSPEASIPLWGGNGPMAFVPEPLIDYPILLTGRVGTLGSIFRITSPCWPSDNTLILKPKCMSHFEYLFFNLQRIDFSILNRGSTQPLVTQTDLKSQLIISPEANIVDQFHDYCVGLFRRIDRSEDESRILAASRDALLPGLVSGELRVFDADV